MRLLVTRPLDDAQELAASLRARSHVAVIEPLLVISPDLRAALPLDGVRGLLFTSANGVRAFALRSQRRDLPSFAVGDVSAAAAREIGFTQVEAAGGDVESLAALVAARCRPADGPLLHVAGTVTAGDLAGRLGEHGFDVRRAALYSAEPVKQLSGSCAQELRDGRIDGVVFFSPRTARAFVTLVDTPLLRATTARLTAFALSQAVADAAAPADWRRIVVAKAPNEAALLSSIDQSWTDGIENEARQNSVQRTPAVAASMTPEPPPAQRGLDRPPRGQEASRGWLLPVLIVAVIAVVALALDIRTLQLLQEPVEPPRAVVSDVAERLERLERGLGAVPPVVAQTAALAQRVQQLEAGLGALGASLDGVAGRVTALDRDLRQDLARPREPAGADPVALTSAIADTQRLAGEVQRMRTELGQVASTRALSRRGDGLVLAVGQLREAAAAGRGYADDLAALRKLAGADAALLSMLDRIAAGAAQGVAPISRLKDRFPAMANAAVHAARQGADDGSWWRPIADRLTALIALRRVGEIDGDDVEAILARAERRLDSGDLGAAIEGLAKIEGPATVVIAPWLAQAKSRAGLDAALAELARLAIQG